MLAQTIKAAQVIALVFISFAASAQSYHQPIRVDQFNQQGIPDSSSVAHLEISVRQSEGSSMKFRVVVINPFTRPATITISRGDDILYTENGVRGEYQNLFNLDQLEDGDYQIVVTSGKEKVRKDISIHTETRTDRQVQLN